MCRITTPKSQDEKRGPACFANQLEVIEFEYDAPLTPKKACVVWNEQIRDYGKKSRARKPTPKKDKQSTGVSFSKILEVMDLEHVDDDDATSPPVSPRTAGVVRREAVPDAGKPSRRAAPKKDLNADDADTIIFVDTDGVLNITMKDQRNRPPIFNEVNMTLATRMQEHGEPDRIARSFLALGHSTRPGENCTYSKFLSRSDIDISDVLVQRLVEILKAAGERSHVVLCFNPRTKTHEERIQRVELLISEALGKPFAFDDRVKVSDKSVPADRLRNIGDYLEEYCSATTGADSVHRVLVLDDFFISPMRGWNMDGTKVDSAPDVEQYLEARVAASAGATVRAKMLHTYHAWVAEGKAVGLDADVPMEVGAGLGLEHVRTALSFLKRESFCQPRSVSRKPSEDEEFCNEMAIHSESSIKSMPYIGQSCSPQPRLISHSFASMCGSVTRGFVVLGRSQ